MPRRGDVDPSLEFLIRSQDWLVHRDQALDAGMTRRAIDHRLAYQRWQVLLPSVYLTHAGEPSRRQQLIAALLYAGEDAAIDGRDACRWHGVKALGIDEDHVYVVAPWGSPARSTGFVVVRRTIAPIHSVRSDWLRYVDAATATVVATRQLTSDRTVLAVLSDVLQRNITTYEALVVANVNGPRRNATRADKALAQLSSGARSVAEVDFLMLAEASPSLPKPECNALLRLPCGRLISPDAWFKDSAVIHETNGRGAHRREDRFEDMQDRHSVMTDAGFEVYHSTPRQLAANGRVIVNRVERACVRRQGFGVPPGVEVVSLAG